MSLRQTLYDILIGSTELEALVGNRIYQRSSLEGAPRTPFVVFHLSLTNPELTRNALSQSAAVWVHDTPGDYAKIDETLEVIRKLFMNTAPTGELLEIRWIESSEDLRDPAINTITRFCRAQLMATSRQE